MQWRPTAAYLYILQLDGPGLAWEYLRRNPSYRRDWGRYQLDRANPQSDLAARWGLDRLENPDRDARDAKPIWTADLGTLVLVREDDDPSDRALPFQLWRFPGRKHLTHDGKRLVLTCQVVGHVWRVALSPALSDGMAHAFALPADGGLRSRLRTTEADLAFLDGVKGSRSGVASVMPSRPAMLHMHALQTLDGMLAGASQRDVAEVLFGVRIVAECWDENCELRSRVRRLMRRGRRYMTSDYQRLLRIGRV
jgi:hypothetical protein